MPRGFEPALVNHFLIWSELLSILDRRQSQAPLDNNHNLYIQYTIEECSGVVLPHYLGETENNKELTGLYSFIVSNN
jgi:hypothetical protein